MAEEDEYKRRRRREEERDREEEEERLSKIKKEGGVPVDLKSGDLAQKIDELILRAEPMIDQVNGLYTQYFLGTQKLPPEERRRQLDQLMVSIASIHKPTAGLLFRYSNLQANYSNHKERWDKVLRDIETGKIKRPQVQKLK